MGRIRIRPGAGEETKQKLMTFKYLAFSFIVIASIAASCVSSESPKLEECRMLQDSIHVRIAALDSALNEQMNWLREGRDALSNDTLLATDSLLRERYAGLKELVNKLEFTQAELHAWRDHLIVLPSPNEVAAGIDNPFGAGAGDDGALRVLKSYSDTLFTIEQHVREAIRSTSYERTPPPQP